MVPGGKATLRLLIMAIIMFCRVISLASDGNQGQGWIYGEEMFTV